MQESVFPIFDIEHPSKEYLDILLAHYLVLQRYLNSSKAEKQELAYEVMKTKGIELIKRIETDFYDWVSTPQGLAVLEAARKARTAYFQYEERL